MSIKQIRLSSQAKDQLIRLKTKTGIQQWNVLCRWPFRLSLRQPNPPSPVEVPADSNVEMSWQVFAGEAQELYLAFSCPTTRCVVLVPITGAFDPGCDDALRELERRGYAVWRVQGSAANDAARNRMAVDAIA